MSTIVSTSSCPNIVSQSTSVSCCLYKHLCLEILNDGSWQKHIDLITKKVYTRVNILRKLNFFLDRKTLEKIYLTFIRPILEYADVVWDIKTLFLVNKSENVLLSLIDVGALFHNLTVEGRK
jgi:hypothetical protein